jgi:hypothetical protein
MTPSMSSLRGKDLSAFVDSEEKTFYWFVPPGTNWCRRPPASLGSEAWVLVRRRNSSLIRSSAFVVRSAFHCEIGQPWGDYDRDAAGENRGRRWASARVAQPAHAALPAAHRAGRRGDSWGVPDARRWLMPTTFPPIDRHHPSYSSGV